MIPLAPVLLIAAVQSAVAARSCNKVGRYQHLPNADESLGLVNRVGFWSHYDAGADRSSWPLGASPSLDVFAAEVSERHVLRREPEEGAIVLVAARSEDGKPEGSTPYAVKRDSTPPFCQLGIITRVVRRSILGWEPVGSCDVVWVVGDSAGRLLIACDRIPFDVDRGDRFVHWWDVAGRTYATYRGDDERLTARGHRHE